MLNKLKNLLKPIKPNYHKVAIIPGHNAKGRGAVRVDNKVTEFDYWNEVAKYCVDFAEQYKLDVKVFNRNHLGAYTREIKECYGRVNLWNPLVTAELHFNASNNIRASGCEVLHSGSPRGIEIAQAVYDEAQKVFQLNGRGIKAIKKGGRGYQSVVTAKAPSVLTEFYFGSSKKDCKATATEDDKKAYAHVILAGIAKAI